MSSPFLFILRSVHLLLVTTKPETYQNPTVVDRRIGFHGCLSSGTGIIKGNERNQLLDLTCSQKANSLEG